MKTVLTMLLFLASACSAQQIAVGKDSDLTAVLTKRYADQTLRLRQAVAKDSQTYDATGKLLSPGEEGPWTLYAGVSPTSFSLSDEELRIQGDRILFVFDSNRRLMVPEKTDQRLQVIIRLAKPLASPEDAEPLLHSVFAMNNDELSDSVPDFWKPYLSKEAENSRAAMKQKWGSSQRKKSRRGGQRRPREADVFFVDGKEVHAPEATFTPDPSYTEVARDRSLQGSVVIDAIVDDTGKVLRPQIIWPLGMGLDEKAIETIQTWRFKPATRNGQPVKVEMAVEISFKLYWGR